MTRIELVVLTKDALCQLSYIGLRLPTVAAATADESARHRACIAEHFGAAAQHLRACQP